jgi:hypothetical protein
MSINDNEIPMSFRLPMQSLIDWIKYDEGACLDQIVLHWMEMGQLSVPTWHDAMSFISRKAVFEAGVK